MKQLNPRPPASSNASLPVDNAWLFPEYEFAQIDLETHRGVIIERMLEQGSWAVTAECLRTSRQSRRAGTA